MIVLRDELGLNNGEAVGSDGLEIPTDTYGNSVRSTFERRDIKARVYLKFCVLLTTIVCVKRF